MRSQQFSIAAVLACCLFVFTSHSFGGTPELNQEDSPADFPKPISLPNQESPEAVAFHTEASTSNLSTQQCNSGCCNGCCCSNGSSGLPFGLSGLNLFGLDLSSDRCFEGFIEPVTNPVYSMDPRSRTRLRLMFINQMIPGNSILGGGDFQEYGAQLSVAFNERFSFIAQKDGWIQLQAGGLPHADGFGDMAAGLKYVLVRDVEDQFLLSGGIMFETSNGSGDVFQGNGSGMWTFFLTAGKEFGDCGQYHVVGTVGWNLPNHGGQESESIYYSLHLDRRMTDNLYFLWELNGFTYVDSGRRLGVNVEGGDLINLGAANVDGNNFITTAFGITYKWNDNVQIAAAHEFPITERKDIMDNRTSVMLSIIF